MRKLSLAFVALGAALLLAAGVVLVGFSRQDAAAQSRADALLQQVEDAAGEAPDASTGQPNGSGAQPDAGAGEIVLAPKDVYAVVEVPELGLVLPVLNRYSDTLLETAPCLYPAPEGTADARPVLAGHNYASHFKAIPSLAVGAEVRLTTLGGAAVAYTVTGVEEIAEDDFAGLYAGSWDLTLFTCNFFGDKRILVRCALAA